MYYVLLLLLLLCLLFSATTSRATKRPWLTKPLDDSRYCTCSTMEPKILFLDNCKHDFLLWPNYSTFYCFSPAFWFWRQLRPSKGPLLTKPLDDSRYCTSSTMEPKILFNCKYYTDLKDIQILNWPPTLNYQISIAYQIGRSYKNFKR